MYMKLTLFSLTLSLTVLSAPAFAQEAPKRDTIRVGVETPAPSQDEQVIVNGDTTVIKVSGRNIVIVKSDKGTSVDIEKPKDGEDAEGNHYEYRYDDHADHDDHEDSDDCGDCDDEGHKEGRRDKAKVGLYGLDLGFSNLYLNGNFNSDIAGMSPFGLKNFESLNVSNHFLPTRVPFGRKGHVNLKTAITLDYSWYHFTNGALKLNNNQANILPVDTFETAFNKNKLRTFYVQVPLLLNINTDSYGGDDGISVSFGGYAGVLANGQTILGSKDNKQRYDGAYNLSTFRYGLMARVDFNWFDVYVNYGLSPFFKEGQGPEAHTITAGVNLFNF